MFDEAITYAERHMLHALIVSVDGDIVVSRTATGTDIDAPHALYSGTKSFWGITAAAAAEDGLLSLDEPLGATMADWPADAPNRAVTVRQLLALTAGYPFGGLGNAVPTGARALAVPLKDPPGAVFTYGGIPLQVFGEVLRRKLAPHYDGAHAYLQGRVLDRIGLHVQNWRQLRDGTRPLPTGAFVSAPEWLKFGRLLLERGAGVIGPAAFRQCAAGSAANPNYGLGLWLVPGDTEPAAVYASGAGGQGLYVLFEPRIVAVRFGRSTSWNHAAFLKRLAAG